MVIYILVFSTFLIGFHPTFSLFSPYFFDFSPYFLLYLGEIRLDTGVGLEFGG